MVRRKKMSGAASGRHRDTQLLLTRALHAFDSGDVAGSIELARRVVRRDDGHLGAWELLAKGYWRTGRLNDALHALEWAIRMNPYEPGYFYIRGLIQQGLGQFPLAVESFQRCAASVESPWAATAVEALHELEAWQETLIAERLRIDPSFRRSYRQDAQAACASLGYRFSESESKSLLARLEAAQRALVWARPE